jgi:DNA-binding beta-propeller fold protein YncE
MNINRRIAIRLSLLVTFAVILTAASSRPQADTGTCGGASVTLPFTDVPGTNAFFCSIAEAYYSGLANGTTSTTYSPGGNVTRAQMAAFVTRTLDQSLKRGSRRAALQQWATPTSVPFTGTTTVGTKPFGIACDGADLWVANEASGTVSRVRASDGKLLENWTGATGAQCVLIARGRVFITGLGDFGKIYVIDPKLGVGAVTTLTSLLPEDPIGITFDGFNLWVANSGGNSISRVHPNTGAVTTFTGFDDPRGILFDGTHIWAIEFIGSKIKKVDPASGIVLQTIDSGGNPIFPAFDGTNLWVPNKGGDSVTVVRVKDSAGNPLNPAFVLATLTGNGMDFPITAAFDGERILVTNLSDNVALWRASDLTPLGFFAGATDSLGACSDGLNFWITLYNSSAIARF